MNNNDTLNHQSPSGWHNEDWKKELVDIFFAKRGIILFTTLIVLAISLLIAFFWPPTYQSEVSILVRGTQPQVHPGQLGETEIRTPTVEEEDLMSELNIITSPKLIHRTLMALYGDSEENTELRPEEIPFTEQGGDIENAISYVSNNLKRQIVPNSKVIKVSYNDKDKNLAESILEELVAQYKRYRIQIFSPADEAEFMTERKNYYREMLQAKENELIQLGQKDNVALIQQEMDNNILLKKDLSQQLSQKRIDYDRTKRQLEPLKNALEGGQKMQLFAFLQNNSLEHLVDPLIALLQERENKVRFFLESTPKIKTLDKQIETVYGLLRDEAELIMTERENHVESLAAAIKRLESHINELVEKNLQLHKNLILVDRIKREIRILESSYETYSQRSEEAQINEEIIERNLATGVSVLSGVRYSAKQIYPDKKRTPIIGLIAGFILGCSFAFVSEYLDHTLKRPQEVQRYLGLPVVCSINKV